MKINIGPYRQWIGPYQLAELLCFWAKKEKNELGLYDKPRWVHKFGEFLAYGSIAPEPKIGEEYELGERNRKATLLYRCLLWLDSKKERKVQIRIDDHDVWSMDTTLAMIILPMLRRLKQQKQGIPWVDPEDVPEELRATPEEQEALNKDGTLDKNFEARWNYVLDSMIWSFECVADPDEQQNQFFSGEPKLKFVKLDNGYSELINDGESNFDFEGYKKHQEEVQRGLTLFGKYYQSLWS